MKVLRVINNLKMGGAERSLETNVPVHIENGYEMDVYLLDGTDTPFKQHLLENGVKVYSSGLKSVRNPLQIFKLLPLIKKYDIVHVHLFPALYWAAMAKILSFSKTKMVFTEHNTSNTRRDNLLLSFTDHIIYKVYDHIITISPAAQENLSKYLGWENNMTMIPNGVNLRPFEEQKDVIELFPGSKKYFVVSQIASFREQKDQDTTIRALQYTSEDVHVCFVGVGHRQSICEELAKKLNVAERVHFLGQRMDIPAIVKSSSAISMSSHYEGFGRAAIEGMAGCKPVLGTNVSGLGELVRGAGILFEVGDAQALGMEIEKLRSDAAYYYKIAKSCYNRAQLYSSDRMIEGYEKIYKDLIK